MADISIHNLFINYLCQFLWHIKSTDTSDYLFLGESWKSASALDRSVNMKFNFLY